MDFIKQFYEKLIISLVLIGLIGSAGYLTWKTMSQVLGNDSIPRVTRASGVQPLDTAMYDTLAQMLAQPPEWKSDPDRFFRTDKIPAQTPVIVDGSKTSTPVQPIYGPVPPLHFTRTEREWFNLRFESYTFDGAKGEARNFQINFANRAKTYFVPAIGSPVGDRFENTQYIIRDFQRILTNVVTGAGVIEEDISALTIQAPGEQPVVLVRGRLTPSEEPLAWVQCQERDAKNPEKIVRGREQRVRRGSAIRCQTNVYYVVDIKSNEMLIVGPSESQTNIVLRAVDDK